eukprot:symbB.v1.2.008410.t1/scaffold528.1/size191705/1
MDASILEHLESLQRTPVLLSQFLRSLDLPKQLLALEVLTHSEVKAEIQDYTVAISECGKAQLWRNALWLFQCMRQVLITPNVITCNAIIASCGKALQWQQSLHVLYETSIPSGANLISYNSAMTSCAKGFRWPLTLHLMASMSEGGLVPDLFTYNSSITSCEKALQWQLALELFVCLLKEQRLK